ncbi:hypothetical protein BH09SUM1_BH09SUM1_02350 [soil metagenome]
MTRDAISRSHDGVFTMELIEESRPSELSVEAIDRAQIALTAALCWATFELVLVPLGNIGHAIAGCAAVLALIGLLFADKLRTIIGDLYRQMQYREKFIFFLLHVAVVVGAIAGTSMTPSMALCVLLIVLCFEGIDAIFFGRIMALAMVIAFVQFVQLPVAMGYFRIALCAAWFALWLLTARATYIRFRMEQFGEGRGADLFDMFRRTLLLTVVPAVCWVAVYLYANPRLERRTIFWAPQEDVISKLPPQDFSLGTIVMYAASIVAIVVGCIALLNWLEKWLVRTKRGAAIDEDLAGASMRIMRGEDTREKPMVEDPPSGPRERILRGFRKFAADQISRGLARHAEETAEDYFNRLGGAETVAAEPFNKACYAVEEPTEADEARFFEGLKAVEKRMTESVLNTAASTESA